MEIKFKHLTTLIATFFLCLFFIISASQSLAQKSATTTVKASVGNYYLSVSGWASPFASIVMSTNSILMASTVADPKGNFSIERVLVNEGFREFCLEAIDVKRIGSSFTCFKISPVKGNSEKRNIFLPPTIGLSGKKIIPGFSVFASGYSMPNAKVLINISEDIIIETKANSSGFYKVEIKSLPAGKYKLFATARYENRDSQKPDKKLDLQSISFWELIWQNLLLILLIVVIILILLIILLRRRLRDKIRSLIGKKPLIKKKVNFLHHGWFLGF